MGEIVLAAKVTHVPSMFISELPGEHHGCREPAIEGHREIGRRAAAAGADTYVVLDTHWLVNSGYHINANPRHVGTFTSKEFPQFIQELSYDYRGAPDLGDAIADLATERGVATLAHDSVPSLGLDYGTLVPMHYQNPAKDLEVLTIAAWMYDATFEESRVVGEAIRDAIAESDRRVALLASGSLSHRIWPNRDVQGRLHEISHPFNEHVDKMVLSMWKEGRIGEFLEILPDYATHCFGEGHMHDTAMLLAALGWDQYKGAGEIITDWFPSSGTGQCNVVFPTAW